jgi:hypothetical protein
MGTDAFVSQEQKTNQRCMDSIKQTTGMFSNPVKKKKKTSSCLHLG